MRKRLVNFPIVAIHEAGHAVARFLTAEVMGIGPSAAVTFVQIYPLNRAPEFMGADGIKYSAEGGTFGPAYSEQLKEAARKIDTQCDLGALSPEDARDMIAACRATGVDTESWTVANITIAIAGVAAEAKACEIPFWVAAKRNRLDLDEAARTSKLAGWPIEQLESCVHSARAYLEQVWAEPRTWNALLTLAHALPAEGRMEGRECWAIYSRALESAEGSLTST